jgi:hypothetical protein
VFFFFAIRVTCLADLFVVGLNALVIISADRSDHVTNERSSYLSNDVRIINYVPKSLTYVTADYLSSFKAQQ